MSDTAAGETGSEHLARYELPGLAAREAPQRAAMLSTTVYLLEQGGQLEKIVRLVGDQRWMRDRFTGSRFRHDDYMEDVGRGFVTTNRMIESGVGSPEGVTGDALWLALLRGSVGSLSAGYSAAAVRRAVELGTWSGRRAAGLAHTLADAERRLELCRALLDTSELGGGARSEVELLAVGAALDQEYEHARLDALVDLAPWLHGGAWRRALETAIAAPDAEESGRVIEALISSDRAQLTTVEAEQILDLPGEAAERAWRAASIAPVLSGEQLARSLAAILNGPDLNFTQAAIRRVAPRLDVSQLALVLSAIETTEHDDAGLGLG